MHGTVGGDNLFVANSWFTIPSMWPENPKDADHMQISIRQVKLHQSQVEVTKPWKVVK